MDGRDGTAPVRVELAGKVVADTTRGYRVLETSHPPVYFFPPDDIRAGALRPVTRQTGAFYGGWITQEVVGPFKGGPGTEGW